MITRDMVTQTWKRIAQLSTQDVPLLINQMKSEQPFIVVYLLALDNQPFDHHEGELIFYIGMVSWQMIRQSPIPIRKVTYKQLQKAEKENISLLNLFSSDSDADFISASRRVLETYSEPNILGYIIEALIEEENYQTDDPPIRDELHGLAFIQVKTVLDALISNSKK